jgi:hypothetical protein
MTYLMQDANRELAAAQSAFDATETPSLEVRQRLETAKNSLAAIESWQRVGFGIVGGAALAGLHRYPNSPRFPLRPNMEVYAGEKARINQYLAQPRPRLPGRKRPKPTAP